ncbi:MAG: DUF2125 domain-containing protein, partial [Hyphococcus sp.]
DADAQLDGETYALADIQTVMSLSKADLLGIGDDNAAWRAAGGALSVTGLIATIEDSHIAAAGEIRLDADNRPDGALKTEIANPAGFARALGKTGVLSHNEAEAAAAGLTLMAVAGGGKLAAPLEFKNGEAQVAGIKIADLPALK